MSDFISARLESALWIAGDWSLRWGLLIAAVAVWLALRPPRQAAIRLAVCQLTLVAGMALPLVPHWWGRDMLPARWAANFDQNRFGIPPTESKESQGAPVIVEPSEKTIGAASVAGSLTSVAQQSADVALDRRPPSAIASPAPQTGSLRIVLVIAAGLWAFGACIHLIRLAGAWLWLSRLCRTAVDPKLRSRETFDRCRREMGLRRSVRLGTHSALRSPVFVGGRRCSVLVPADWDALPAEAQRAILWHELAHVARHDDLAKLAEELVRALFFFHPLVRWLLNRIDGYREEVCDAMAVRRGVAGRTLAEILVDFSRRQTTPHHHDAAVRPALPFFHGRTVKNRVTELLQDETVARWSAPVMRRQFAALTVGAAAMLVVLGSFGLRAADSPTAPVDQKLNVQTLKSPAVGLLLASDSATASGQTKSDAESRTLKRILANWKARQDRIQAFYFAWDERTSFGPPAADRTNGQNTTRPDDEDYCIVQMKYWFEGRDRFRLERKLVKSHGPRAAYAAGTQEAFDGASHTRLGGLDNPRVPPLAKILKVDVRVKVLDPFWLIFRAIDPLGIDWRPDEFHVITENAVIDKLHCTKIQRVVAGRRWIDNCWVDPARDDVIVIFERKLDGQLNDQISIQYQRHKEHGWVPSRWTSEQQRASNEGTVTAFTMNETYPASTFTIKFPPGTSVVDEPTNEQFVVANDGSRTQVERFESYISLNSKNALELATDFRIEPQPLKDAIEFIKSRYNIPILIDEKGFREASIDPTMEVEARTPGIKLREMLKSLLARSPKPVGFRVENEVLQISPRFAGKQPTLKPLYVPQKIHSAAGRAIQAELESRVDFAVESQPLRETIDFLRSRYRISIVIDEQGFRDASIDLDTEIRANVPGIKLRSLLAILLQQCPKPIGFTIEGDTLKIAPITTAK